VVKKYKVIAKVGNENFVKYNVNNLRKFTEFLDKNFKDWRWFNVYDKKTKQQLTSYTKYRRPNNAHLNTIHH